MEVIGQGRPRKLQILFVTEFLPWPLNTGGRIRTFHLLRQASLRHNVTLLTQICMKDTTGMEEVRQFIAHLSPTTLNQRARSLRVLGAAISIFDSRPYVSVYSHYRKAMAKNIKQLINDQTFDIIHLDHLDSAAYLKACRSNAVIYLDEHNYETDLLRSTHAHTSKSLLRWYLGAQLQKLERFEGETLQSVNGVGVVSQHDAARVSASAPHTPCEVIPNGVDPEFFDIIRRPQPYRVISVSSLDWLPNVEGLAWFLDEVWPIVVAARPQATFQMVGRNPHRSLLKRRHRGVSIIGSVPDIRDYVTDASAFVVPLLSGSGTRLRVLEAMAMRIPIVSTKVGIEGIECIPDRHVLVSDTARHFADQLIALLDDDILGKSLAQAGKELVERFYCWETIGDRLDAFYRRMVCHK
jgi:glycosyltransferase involved in cell wall biosynthesis